MNWLVYHVGSGGAFFSGVALLLLAVLLSTRKHWLLKRLTVLTFLVGVIAIAISSTAMPYWQLAMVFAATLAWIASAWVTRWRHWTRIVFCVVWLFAAVWEATYWVEPTLSPVSTRHVTIFGDSVTAGLGEGSIEAWPAILNREHGIQVQDLSGVGFRTSDALKRAKDEGVDAPLVLVEIGGNDLLGGRSAARFSQDLDELLALLTQNNRQVVMFELPLPPLCGEYGRVQRRLAAKHGVRLIPKRVFLSILAPPDATLDTIHLSQAGQNLMVTEVWRLIEPVITRNEAIAPSWLSKGCIGSPTVD